MLSTGANSGPTYLPPDANPPFAGYLPRSWIASPRGVARCDGQGLGGVVLQVNVKRGMLRLWVVLSVLWLVIALPIAWKGVTGERCATGGGTLVAEWECDRLPIPRGAVLIPQETLPLPPGATLTPYEAPPVPPARTPGPTHRVAHPPNSPQWEDAPLPRRIPYWPERIGALIFIFAPPVAIMIAGISVLWISAGFRGRNQ